MPDTTPPNIPIDPIRVPPDTGVATLSDIAVLQASLAEIKQTVTELTNQLAELNSNFAKHVHGYAGSGLSGEQRFANFIQYPEQYNEFLIPFSDPNDVIKTSPVTGTFVIPAA